jgi:hypothetical protein
MLAIRLVKFAALLSLLVSIPLERAAAQDASAPTAPNAPQPAAPGASPPTAEGTPSPPTQTAPAPPPDQATPAPPAAAPTPKAPRSAAKRRPTRSRHHAGRRVTWAPAYRVLPPGYCLPPPYYDQYRNYGGPVFGPCWWVWRHGDWRW